MRKLFTIAVAVLLLASCGHSTKTLLPNVSGKAGEVIVVMDKTFWDGSLGNEVRGSLAADCPYLAQREPLYNLVNVNPSAFADIFKVHRNIVLFDVNPQVQKEDVLYLSDIWSHPQCVVKLSAKSEESAIELFKSKSELILASIEQAERNRVVANTLQYEEKSIAPQVREVMGGSPHFPVGYKLKKKNDGFVWVADEKQYSILGIFLYKFPASGDESDFSYTKLLSERNKALMENVPGMFENTYMTTSEFIPPTVTFAKYKGRDFAQMRGFWEVHNDYMGGPFVSHAFYTPDGKDVLVVEAFVYAPKYDKRHYLRQVESLLYSFEWDSDGKN